MSIPNITVTIVPGRPEAQSNADTVTFRSKDFTYVFNWVVLEEGLYDFSNGGATQILRAIEHIEADRQYLQDLHGAICLAIRLNASREVDYNARGQMGLELHQLANKVDNDLDDQLCELLDAVDEAGMKRWRRMATWRPGLMTYEWTAGYAPNNPLLGG
ncbi:MAG: hypothetical protein Q9208_007565 [Pyrenodesmia sp. 3 TL-2023]